MMEIYYKNSRGEIVYFDRFPYYMLEGTTLFDVEREYKATGQSIQSVIFQKSLRKKELDIAVCGKSREEHDELVNQMVNVLDADVIDKVPGELHVAGYYIRCYFHASKKPARYINTKRSAVSFNVIIGKSLWIKEYRHEYVWSEKKDTGGRGYNYEYEYDYTIGNGNVDTITNEHFAECEFVLKVCGYIMNPAITIGNHLYRVAEVVQANEILTIDTRNKSITLTKNNGVQVNTYSKRDKASFVFEPIPAGEHRIYWNGNYNFEITLYEERSEPKWK